MKPNPSNILVEGSLGQKGRKMDFDPDSIAHIMRLLIDLYSDKELAIIRELSTNAIDSHIMSGNKSPITVQTPTPLSPYLTIEDLGLGLTVEEIYGLFGRYGASTKRDTNEATGMLGLGSKSPLTYTNQFTMTAVKDGVEAVVAITRDEDGVGNLTVVDTRATKSPNGVKIKIPAKTNNSLERKAKEFFQYWKPGTVILNGRDPSGLSATSMEITPDIHMVRGDRYSAEVSVVVMGNVPYPAPTLDYATLGVPQGHRVVAFVSIGDVDFAPSREALQDTKRTRDTLTRITSDFRRGITNAVQRDIDTATDGLDALTRMNNWSSLYPGYNKKPDFTWKGKTLPWRFSATGRQGKDRWGGSTTVYDKQFWMMQKADNGYGRSRANAGKWSDVEISTALTSIFITDFDLEAVTLTHRRKATQWLDNQTFATGSGFNRFVMMDFKPEGLDLIPAERIVSWDVVKQEKLPKATTTAGSRIPGSFDLVFGGESQRRAEKWAHNGYVIPSKDGVPGDDIDQTKPVFFVHGNVHDAKQQFVPILDHFNKEYTIICLPANRLDKFKRENPKIEDANEVIKREAKNISSKMTDDQQKALWMHDSRVTRRFTPWHGLVNKIHDPEFKALVELALLDITSIIKSREMFWGMVSFDIKEVKNYDKVLQRYPLVIGSNTVAEHHLRYVNTEYAYLKQNGGL